VATKIVTTKDVLNWSPKKLGEIAAMDSAKLAKEYNMTNKKAQKLQSICRFLLDKPKK
jgi:hypothetical protein